MLANYSTLAEKKGAKVETVIARGYPSKVILKTAEDVSANLIVIGSRGLSGIRELFLGSVSHAVVQHSTIPVLVVK
jgi:nucleotide-binding universal stress UspA family protein